VCLQALGTCLATMRVSRNIVGTSRTYLFGCIDTSPMCSARSHELGIAEVLEAGAHDRMPFHEGGPMEEEAAALLLLLQFLKGHLTLKGVGKQLELAACRHART